MKYCANVYFNRQCLKWNLIPNYTKIKTPNISPTSIFTKYEIVKLRMKDEIKFLNMNKEKLNNALHKTHLKSRIRMGENPGTALKSP